MIFMKLIKQKNNFMFFVMLCLVFVVSTALAISGPIPLIIKNTQVSVDGNERIFPQNPVLGESLSFPTVSAQGVLALDINSGVSLYEKNADAPLLPASTTKIVTALVSLDTYPLDSLITVGNRANVDGQKMGLFKGEQLKAEDLLYGLLVYSANDSAETLAENYPGGYDAFISAMNTKAQDLGMNNSHFDNPVGLDGDNQRSTARDLARAAEVGMRNPEFAKIVGTKEITFKDASGKISYDLKNLNVLLGNVPGVMGVKTGWTESARENLVTYITRDNHNVVIALLGSQDRFGETKELIDWIFANYRWQDVKSP